MSGLTPNLEDMSLSTTLQNVHKEAESSLRVVVNLWKDIYGHNDSNMVARLKKVEEDNKQFWEYQIEAMEDRKKSLIKDIETKGKEAFNLEKALEIDDKMTDIANTPLINLHEQLWRKLESYKELKEKQIIKYTKLQKDEKDLCLILGQTPELDKNFTSTIEEDDSFTNDCVVGVPSKAELARAEERVQYLEGQKDELQYKFMNLRNELKTLIEECDAQPFTKVERFTCIDTEDFPCTIENYKLLLGQTETNRQIKARLIGEVDYLKEQISTYWTKMMKDQNELQSFFLLNGGFKKSTIEKLQKTLDTLKRERKEKMKELIIAIRTVLDDLWTKCCFSDEQRSKFKPYFANHFTEDVLDLHELEVERIRHFYNMHKNIFQLAARHNELWQRLLHLEDRSKQSDRLFKNRGGQLLQEEKERKLVQKKLPAIKEELIKLLTDYHVNTGEDFLYFGAPLLGTLEQLEEDRQASKENEKLQRKAANTEHIQLESRLGTHPASIAGHKRKLLTPQPPNVSTKVIKLSAHSTTSSTNSVASSKSTARNKKEVRPPESAMLHKRMHSPQGRVGMNFATPRSPTQERPTTSHYAHGSPPSYESFQEHIATMNEECLSSTQDIAVRPLRPKNLNIKSNVPTPRVTPYKTPKTPVKTPKTPFRIATGSKIPTIVPPISPRSTSKRTPRNRLPIIF